MGNKIFFKIFTGKWLLATGLVLIGTFVMIRLGIWQLDRLEQRRNFNARVLEQTNRLPLELNNELQNGSSAGIVNLTGMEYRKVKVTGEYDYDYEIALRNQAYFNQYGVHLLTPLKIDGSSTTVMVDRGWIPGTEFENGLEAGNWYKFKEKGKVEVVGIIRAAQSKPDFGRISDPTPSSTSEKITAWNLVNLDQIQKQIPYPILPIYIQQSPDPAWTSLPYRSEPNLEITEGPHLGYAIQWFTFAAILFFGYPIFFYREMKHKEPEIISSSHFTDDAGDKVNV